jgi:hypothetical protein
VSPIALHGGNGLAMKAETLFRTCKYRPEDYPPNSFVDVHEVRDWVLGFVRWNNHEHRHSSLR